eukprot:6343067-Amphidinium_carterae.1
MVKPDHSQTAGSTLWSLGRPELFEGSYVRLPSGSVQAFVGPSASRWCDQDGFQDLYTLLDQLRPGVGWELLALFPGWLGPQTAADR